ncbi:MAG TPA: AMP-dependent synthetase [Gammaproteobacteria bacterium]|nr:AMP-dependent synthetase [Gammaproteobacteria bacterium]
MTNVMADALARCAKHNPKGEVLVYGDRRITWRELNERVDRLANALDKLGLKAGDKAIIMFHNCPEFFEANYAIQKLGAIPVPMNYRFSPREIVFQAQHSDAKMFILESMWLDIVEEALPELTGIEQFILRGAPREDMLDYESLMQQHQPICPEVPVPEGSVCVICYTGGTTGMPKGVMLTYENHIHLVEQMVAGFVPRFSNIQIPDDLRKKLTSNGVPEIALTIAESSFMRWLLGQTWLQNAIVGIARRTVGSSLAVKMGSRHSIKSMMPSFPMFHDAAYQLAVLGPMMGNMTMVMPTSPHFDPAEVLTLIERERPQMLGNVPTGWKILLAYPELNQYDVSSVQVAATGGGVCTAATKRKIFAAFPGVIIGDGFGQTEMTPTTSFRIDTSPDTLKDRSVGKPLVETKVVDDDGQEVSQGELGEIIYRSPTIMKGYYKEQDKTDEVIKDGWFYSGDLGYFDEDGELRIAERKKECISSGGEKIFPGEIEDILAEHESIQDVCVIGVPDEKWGASVRAVVRLRPGAKELTEEELISWSKERMASYKKPSSVVFTDDFPISAVGKIQRNKVRELYGQPSAQKSA